MAMNQKQAFIAKLVALGLGGDIEAIQCWGATSVLEWYASSPERAAVALTGKAVLVGGAILGVDEDGAGNLAAAIHVDGETRIVLRSPDDPRSALELRARRLELLLDAGDQAALATAANSRPGDVVLACGMCWGIVGRAVAVDGCSIFNSSVLERLEQ
jgi:hypothetical protein